MLMTACFGMKQVICEINVNEFTQFPQGYFGLSQQIFVSKQSVVRQMLKAKMEPRSPAVLRNNEPHGKSSNKPGKARISRYLNCSSGRIITFRHRYCSRIAGNVDEFTVRKPLQQF